MATANHPLLTRKLDVDDRYPAWAVRRLGMCVDAKCGLLSRSDRYLGDRLVGFKPLFRFFCIEHEHTSSRY